MLTEVRRRLADSEPDLHIPTTTVDRVLDEYLASSEPVRDRASDPTDRAHPDGNRPAE